MLNEIKTEFINYALHCGVLKFGEFQLKSGRNSPYFFNTGLFNSGEKLGRLGQFYAKTLVASDLEIDTLYGPAYKGIPLVSATSIAYARLKQDIPYVFNRKEAKDHGEGGVLVGAELTGKTLILDDVITAGTSVRESFEIIQRAGAQVAGVLISLDRQEKGQNERSAIQEIQEMYGIPVLSIITFNDIIEFLEEQHSNAEQLTIIKNYRDEFGVKR